LGLLMRSLIDTGARHPTTDWPRFISILYSPDPSVLKRVPDGALGPEATPTPRG